MFFICLQLSLVSINRFLRNYDTTVSENDALDEIVCSFGFAKLWIFKYSSTFSRHFFPFQSDDLADYCMYMTSTHVRYNTVHTQNLFEIDSCAEKRLRRIRHTRNECFSSKFYCDLAANDDESIHTMTMMRVYLGLLFIRVSHEESHTKVSVLEFYYPATGLVKMVLLSKYSLNWKNINLR